MSRPTMPMQVAPATPPAVDHSRREAVVAAPVKVRRRPAFMVASVASLLLGGLLGAFLWVAATTSVDVVVARNTIERGRLITAADLTTVRIGVDPAVRVVPSSQLPTLVGKRAVLDIAAGTPLAAAQFADQVVPGEGQSVVGLSLASGFLPSIPLKAGDKVRVVQQPVTMAGQQAGVPSTISASVVGVSKSVDGRATLVDVAVSADAAPGLAAQTSSGKIVLVLDSRDR